MGGRFSAYYKAAVLLLIILFPIVIYFSLKTGQNMYKPLPVFGPKEVASTFHTRRGKQIQDTIYHTVPVRPAVDSGKVTMTNFLLTDDPFGNKAMNEQTWRMVQKFSANPKVQFLTFSADQHWLKDSLADDKWKVIYLPADSLARMAKRDYLLSEVQQNPITHQPTATRRYVMVDHHQRIRGVYKMENRWNIDTLYDELHVLTVELIRDQDSKITKQ